MNEMDSETAFCELVEAAQKIAIVSEWLRQLPIEESIVLCGGDYEASQTITRLDEACWSCHEISRSISDNSNKVRR